MQTAMALSLIAGFILALVLIALVGRGPIRLIMPIVRLFALPFRPLIFLLRLARVIPKAATRARPARNAALGASSFLRRGLEHATEIEIALAELSDNEEEDGTEDASPSSAPNGDDNAGSGAIDENSSAKKELYDFTEEKAALNREGVIFRSIHVKPSYFPSRLTSSMSEDIAHQYLAEAKKFFNRKVSLEANEHALYEDAEGAFIISLFRKNDRRCYYFLNEMRKTINGNARRLILVLTAILVTAITLTTTLLRPNPLYWIGACVAAILWMQLWHNAAYANRQKHNTRELRAFLTRYLGRVSDRYREATAMARGVTVGDETDSKKLSEDAQKWHKIVIWMPFRTFFIECFIRNILFQIHRNCNYYLLSMPIVLAAIAGGLYVAFTLGFFEPLNYLSRSDAALILSNIVVLLFYIQLITKVVVKDELSQHDWLGYDNLNVSAAMDDVVGKYAEDVGFWKGRLDR